MGKPTDKKKAKRTAKLKKRLANEKKRKDKVGQPRSCNGCTVCCTVLGVEPLYKGPYQPCEHTCEKGCGIYETRPPICGQFYCLWQTGMGTMNQRPDKIRIVFAPTVKKVEATGEQEIQAYEVDPGALDNPEVMALCRRLAGNGALILGHVYGRHGNIRVMGNPVKTKKFEAMARSHGAIVNNIS